MLRDVHSCTHWLRPRNPSPPPAFGLVLRGRYWSAKIDDISLPPGEIEPSKKNIESSIVDPHWGIRIQHFRSVRIRIQFRIRVQKFDEQRL